MEIVISAEDLKVFAQGDKNSWGEEIEKKYKILKQLLSIANISKFSKSKAYFVSTNGENISSDFIKLGCAMIKVEFKSDGMKKGKSLSHIFFSPVKKLNSIRAYLVLDTKNNVYGKGTTAKVKPVLYLIICGEKELHIMPAPWVVKYETYGSSKEMECSQKINLDTIEKFLKKETQKSKDLFGFGELMLRTNQNGKKKFMLFLPNLGKVNLLDYMNKRYDENKGSYPCDQRNLVEMLITMVWMLDDYHSKFNGDYYAHRDIKPENLVIDAEKGSAKWCDVAFACKKKTVKNKRGSVFYIAPEAYYKDSFDPRIADVYSLAIVLIFMLNTEYLEQSSRYQQLNQEEHSIPPMQIDENLFKPYIDQQILSLDQAAQLFEILNGMLAIDPKNRLSFEAASEKLKSVADNIIKINYSDVVNRLAPGFKGFFVNKSNPSINPINMIF